MNPNWYPGNYLDPKHWPEWMPDAFPGWLPASLVRTPPEIPPDRWSEPTGTPNPGLFDVAAEKAKPKSPEEQWADFRNSGFLPVRLTPAAKPNYSLLDFTDRFGEPFKLPPSTAVSAPWESPPRVFSTFIPPRTEEDHIRLRNEIARTTPAAGLPGLRPDPALVPVIFSGMPIAPPVADPESAAYWSATSPAAGAGDQPPLGFGVSLGPAPQAPDWNSLPTSLAAMSPFAAPEPPVTQASEPQSGKMEEPTSSRSALDALVDDNAPLFLRSGIVEAPPSGRKAPPNVDLADPWAAAAYRTRQSVRSTFGRGDPQRTEAAIRAAAVSALDPFGIPSWAVGLVSPEAKDLIRAQYEDQPIPAMIGSFATPTPRSVVGAIEAAAKAAPKITAGVLGTGGAVLSADEAQGAGRLPMSKAARIGRADAAGFWRNVSTEFGRAPLDEKTAGAALKLDGRIFTGQTHYDAMQRAELELGKPFDKMDRGLDWDGYMTNAGRYVSRREAADIASRTGQGESKGVFGEKKGLAAADTTMAAPGVTPSSTVRTAATAPGLPGGQGVWVLPESVASGPGARISHERQPPAGTSAPAESVEARQTALTWHRSQRPTELDARGLSDYDVQVALKRAWEQGHNTAMLRNYTSPAGRSGDVLVVPNLAQLRDPEAAFDPARRNWWDVMASLASAGLLGPYFAGARRPTPDQ